MVFEFKLPDIGEGVSEGEIVKWHVKEGDILQKEQEMVEIMTDKVTVNIPSPIEGKVLKILYKEGEIIQVGSSIIQIEGEGPLIQELNVEKEYPREIKSEENEMVENDNNSADQDGERKVVASPTIRRIARERNIDLDLVVATGPNGRVTLEDLDKAELEAQKREQNAMAEKIAHPEPEKVEERVVEKVAEEKPSIAEPSEPIVHKVHEETPSPKVESVRIQPLSQDQILELKGLRRIIFEKMTKSKSIIPHFTVAEELDLTELSDTIKRMKEKEIKISYTPFFIKAVTVALKDFPKLNSVYDEANKRYIMKSSYNIGTAIDTPEGLTVGVVKAADKKSVQQIYQEISEIAKRARENKMTLSDVQDSTFTVSNVGSIGGIFSTPIINYPEVAILGVHRVEKRLSIDGEERDIMYISLSCDHRLIDGADAARFIMKLKGYLEDPASFLIK
ncbi:MAG: dihydrolipoamide acetyltransferase family protein [Thermoplasmataceae archaeon]